MVFENFLLPERTSKYNLVQGKNLMSKRNNQSYSKLNSSTVFRENFGGPVEIIAGKRTYADGYSKGDEDTAHDIKYKVPPIPGSDKEHDLFKRQEKKLKDEKVKFDASYNQLVQQYSGSAVRAAQAWKKYKKQLNNCENKCFNDYGVGDNKDIDKEKACKVGCHLNGAYIKSCQNGKDGVNWDNVQITNKEGKLVAFHTAVASLDQHCFNLAKEKKCKGTDAYGENGGVIDENVNSLVKSACCSCGGGYKGRRITDKMINMPGSDTYTNCSDTKHQNICSGAKLYEYDADYNADLTREDTSAKKFQSTIYASLINNNSALKSKMDEMNAKLNKLTKREQSLIRAFQEEDEMGGKIGDNNENSIYNNYKRQQERLEKLIGKFGRIDMMGNAIVDPSLEKNHKLIAMNQDTLLKLNSEKMKFAFWSVLALILGIATITSFKKKVE